LIKILVLVLVVVLTTSDHSS